MGRLLAWFGVAFGAIYLIYIGGGWWGIYSSPVRITTMTIAAIALGTWAVVAWRNPEWRPRSVMLPAIAAALASLTISTIFSRVPRVSLEYLGYAIVLAALYLLLVRLFADPFFRRRLATLASMLLAVTASVYIVLVIVDWIHWWNLVGGLGVPPLRPGFGGLTYNNPSAVLTMVALLAVPTVSTFGSTTRRGITVIAAVVLVIGVVALMSGSRSGWFALGLTSVIVPIFWLASMDNRATLRGAAGGAWRNRRIRVLGAGTVLVVVGLAAVLAPAILRRALEGGQDLRLAYAAAAIRIFLTSPIVGTGPGTWVIQRPAVTDTSETDYYIPHAHNLEVQTLAELGLVGAIAGAVVVVSVLLLLRKAAADGGRRRWWAWAAGIGLLYFMLHQVLDFYVNMPAFLFAAAIPVAYLDATSSAATASTEPLPLFRGSPVQFGRAASLGGLAVVAVAIAGLLWQEIPALKQAQAVEAANARDWQAADAPAREAAAMDPEIDSYQFTAGLTASHAGDHAAAAAYFQSVATRDDLPEAWLNLAAERAAVGEDPAAVESLNAALRLGNQRTAVTMAAGDLALRIGDRGLAFAAFAKSIARTPSLAADPWWHADPARAAIYAKVIADAVVMSPAAAWEIELMAGDPTLAVSYAGPAQSLAGVVTRAWGGDAASVGALIGLCRANPLDVSMLAWCGRVADRLGSNAEAAKYRERVAIISIGDESEAVELRVSITGMTGRQLPGDPADLWATYTYLRPAPWDILVPSLVHLTVE